MVAIWQRVLPASVALGLSLLAAPVPGQVPIKRLQIGGSGGPRIQAVVPATPRAISIVPVIPGYNLLRLEYVRKELELTDDQQKKLDQLTKQYYDQARQGWANLRGLSAKERQQKLAQIRRKNAERLETFRKQVDELLLPHQRAKLEEIAFRMRARSALGNPRILDQLGVSDEQKASLQQIRDALQEKIRELQEEMLDKSLQVLTADQRDELKKTSTPGLKPQ